VVAWVTVEYLNPQPNAGGLKLQLQPGLVGARMANGIADQLGYEQRGGLVQVPSPHDASASCTSAPRHSRGLPSGG